MHTIAAALLLLLASPATAQETRTAALGTPPPVATVADLAWLEGSWSGDGMGGPATETYSAPAAGQIAGHFVQLSGQGAVAFYELMQVVPRGTSLVYRLRHFGPDLKGWEDAKGGRAIEFPLVALAPGRADFDGLSLRREGGDGLTVWVRIEEDGRTRELPFRYRRAARR